MAQERIKSCATCVHFSALDEQCRKGPPAVFPLMQPQGIAFISAWPPTKLDQWCGAHEAPRDD